MNSQALRYKQSITKRFNSTIVHYSELFKGFKREVKCLQFPLFLLTEGNWHQVRSSLEEGEGSVRMGGKFEYLDLHWSLSNSYWPHLFCLESFAQFSYSISEMGISAIHNFLQHKLLGIQKPTHTKSSPWKIQAWNRAQNFNNVSKQPLWLLILECCGFTLNKQLASF